MFKADGEGSKTKVASVCSKTVVAFLFCRQAKLLVYLHYSLLLDFLRFKF